MRSIRKAVLRAGAAAALVAMTSAAGADVLIVRSIGPSAARFRPGTTLADNQQIVLRATDVLTLLDANGSWTLQGPVSVAAKTRIRSAAAAPQLLNVSERRARIGAVRSVDGSDTQPNLWLIDIARPGAACIVDPAHPKLWRANTAMAGKTILTGPDGATAELDWAEGQDAHEWPAAMPVVAGGAYHLTGFGAAKTVSFTLQPIAVPPTSVAATGKALIDHGCSAQLDLLVAQSANTAGGTGS